MTQSRAKSKTEPEIQRMGEPPRIRQIEPAAAFSQTNLNILAMGGLSWFSSDSFSGSGSTSSVRNHAEKLNWKPFLSIGGGEKVVGGTAHTGRGNLTLIGGGDGILFVNRNINGRWTGFRRMVGQPFGTVFRRHTMIPSIASHGG